MWSDPEDIETWAVSSCGAGWLFGSRVTSEFNRINNLVLFVEFINLCKKALSMCFKIKALYLYGLRQIIVTDMEMLLLFCASMKIWREKLKFSLKLRRITR